MTLTKKDLPLFKVGSRVAYKNISDGIYGGIGKITSAELYSEDEEFEDLGIKLSIETSNSKNIFRDAEDIILID